MNSFFVKAWVWKLLKNNDDYWICAYEYNDNIRTMYENKNSTMNKKLINEFYFPIQQTIYNPNYQNKLSQTKTINNKSHYLWIWTQDI